MEDKDMSKATQEEWLEAYKKGIDKWAFAFGFGSGGGAEESEHGVLNSEYSKEDFIQWMANPDGNKDLITEMSRFFYGVSPAYGNTIRRHAEILTLDYDMFPNFRVKEEDLDDKTMEQIYKAQDFSKSFIEKVVNKPKVREIIKAVLKEGSYCGYLMGNKKEMFIQTLPRGYARFAGMVGDGLPMVEFNFEYFDDKEDRLQYYPKEFKTLHNKSKKDAENKWMILDSKHSICILSEEDDHTFPPFIGMIPHLLEEEEMIDLIKKHARLDAIRMVAQIGEVDNVGNPLIDPGLMQLFQQELKEAFGGDVAVANTLFDIKPVEFSSSGDNNSQKNGLDFLTKQKESSSGMSGALIGDSEITTEAGLTINYYTMIATSMAIVEKIELWMNYQLRQKASPKKFPFKMQFIPVGNYVKTSDFNRKNDIFALGGLLGQATSSIGVNSLDYENALILEKAQKTKESLIVPQSTHTQSGKAGRPAEDE